VNGASYFTIEKLLLWAPNKNLWQEKITPSGRIYNVKIFPVFGISIELIHDLPNVTIDAFAVDGMCGIVPGQQKR